MRENHIVLKNLNKHDLKIFDNVFKNNIIKYNNLIDKISSYFKNDIHWLSQTILSRNNYLSNIYFDYCILEILRKKLKKNVINIIYLQSEKDRKIVEINFSKQFDLKFILKNSKNYKDFKIYKIFLNFYINLKTSIIFLLNKSNKRKKNFLKKQRIILIENFFNKETFDNKSYKDRFYGNLYNYLDEKHKEKIFFLFQNSNIMKLRKQIKVLDKYNLNYISVFDFLNFSDYFFAIIKSFNKKNFSSKKILLNGISLEYLFQDLHNHTYNDINSFFSLLQFLFLKKLKKETYNIKFDQVIDWYENQSLDKGFNYGLKNFFPKTNCIGYEPFALDFDFYSSLIPTKGEIKNDLTPNKIALMGRKVKIHLTKKFKLKKNNFILAPSLRYETIFKGKINKKKNTNKKIKNILLALPISFQDSDDILNVVQNYLKRFKGKSFKFFVNFHPMLDFESLQKNKEIIKKNIKVVHGGFNQIYAKIDCVISNSSSICFEALALSKPVIIVQNSKGVTQNPISIVKKNMWRLVRNEEDLNKAFNDLLIIKQKKSYYKESKFIKKEYFSEINKKKILEFLGIDLK